MRRLLFVAVTLGLLSAGLVAAGFGLAWPRLSDLLRAEASVPAQGCLTDADCDDGDPCTTDRCIDGMLTQCEHYPLWCDDGVGCTIDSCDPAVGCIYVPDDLACDDGYFCIDDICDPVNGCLHLTDSICDDSNYCTVDFCNENTDGCEYTPAANGIPCDDGNPSTTGDVCTAGVCAGTVATPTRTATPTGTPTPTVTPTATPGGTTTPTPGPTRTVTIPPASWANFAWTGASSPQTVADCFGAGNVAVMYRLDAATGTFHRWIRGREELSNMGEVMRFDALLALNASTQPATCTMPDDAAPYSFTIPAGRWANFAWLAFSFPAEVAPQACSEDSIAVIYRLDPATQTFQRWIRGRPELSNMTDVQPYDALLVLNGSGQASDCTFSHYGQLAASSP